MTAWTSVDKESTDCASVTISGEAGGVGGGGGVGPQNPQVESHIEWYVQVGQNRWAQENPCVMKLLQAPGPLSSSIVSSQVGPVVLGRPHA